MKHKPEGLAQGPIRHSSLQDAFIERVKSFMAVIAEVDHTPLEVFLDSFRRDIHPEAELEIWEKIAATYQWATIGSPGLTREQKKNVFTFILGLSMGTRDAINTQNLSNELVAGIENLFVQPGI
jgi:hypothetical protein